MRRRVKKPKNGGGRAMARMPEPRFPRGSQKQAKNPPTKAKKTYIKNRCNRQ
jgi:hypothetical protein